MAKGIDVGQYQRYITEARDIDYRLWLAVTGRVRVICSFPEPVKLIALKRVLGYKLAEYERLYLTTWALSRNHEAIMARVLWFAFESSYAERIAARQAKAANDCEPGDELGSSQASSWINTMSRSYWRR